MDQSQVRSVLLKISFVALALSTWISVGFVMETRPDDIAIALNSEPSVIPKAEDALAVLARLPASIPAQLPTAFASNGKPFVPIKMDVVKLGCWDMTDVSAQPVEARWVRFTGRPCQSDSSPEHIEVMNVTNGYVGTVFSAQEDQLTTDFIPLQEGSNDILVKLGHGDGVVFENRFTLVKNGASEGQ